MNQRLRKLSVLSLIVLFILTASPDAFSKGSRGFSGGRSSSKSYSRTPSRSSTSSRRSTRSAAGQSTRKSYGQAAASSQKGTVRQSSAARRKQNAMSSARTGSAVSTRGMTRGQRRSVTGQQRKQTRNLKAENRSLKRQVRRADRNTARARRDARQARSPITVNNFGGFYPNPGYGLFTLTASMVFANVVSGIYFHDYYNHRMHHSWLWHHHHRNYDRSHWSREKQMEAERWSEYYDSQNIQRNANYVDPGTSRDEDYIGSHVEKTPQQFYGPDAPEAVTVEELPDEGALRDMVLAGALPVSAQAAAPQKVIVQKKTSGGTWFMVVFGSVLIIGIIVLVMYNKGYF